MSALDNVRDSYILYYNDYSLCSLMVRFTLAFCGNELQQRSLDVKEEPINIQQGGQLAEYYLCSINPAGTVPVLVHPVQLSSPITESLDIGFYFCKFSTTLRPGYLAEQIDALLRELHDINYFSLTYTNKPQRVSDMGSQIQALLSESTLSLQYRQALEHKLHLVQTKRAPALDQSSIRLAEEKTEKFLSKIRTHLDDDSIRRGQMWILGTDEPTILDAHTIPFLSRVTDVGRGQILGSSLTRYMENVLKSELWTRVMQDRCTVYKRYL